MVGGRRRHATLQEVRRPTESDIDAPQEAFSGWVHRTRDTAPTSSRTTADGNRRNLANNKFDAELPADTSWTDGASIGGNIRGSRRLPDVAAEPSDIQSKRSLRADERWCS